MIQTQNIGIDKLNGTLITQIKRILADKTFIFKIRPALVERGLRASFTGENQPDL